MNVADRLLSSAERLPDKPALIFHDERLDYAELAGRVRAAAAAFQELGCSPGDRVALLLPNTPAFVEALYGALLAGLIAVPVNAGFTSEEIRAVLDDAGARVVVASESLAPAVQAARSQLPALDEVIVAGASKAPAGTRLWKAFRGDRRAPAAAELAEDAVALLQYTSGTTGKPKGAMLTHANLLANQEQMAATQLKVVEQDVVLCVLPLFHIYALNVGLAFTLSRGATVLLVERFDPRQTLEEIAEHRASVVIGAPPMYVAWVNTPGLEDLDLASVRIAVSGAAALPPHVLERFTGVFGIPIWEGYGLTETSPVLTTAAMDEAIRPGSVGRPVPGVELRLLDEAGRPAAAGDPGEVVVRGPNVFAGYWHAPEETAAVLDDEGWFSTGDIGYLDEGALFLVDRKKDLIIVSGFNVYPREVEEVIVRHPKVADAAIIGVPHPYTGEAVKAVVVLRDGEEATADEIIEHARAHLARFKSPEVVDFVRELPLLPTGKVRRRDLRTTEQP